MIRRSKTSSMPLPRPAIAKASERGGVVRRDARARKPAPSTSSAQLVARLQQLRRSRRGSRASEPTMKPSPNERREHRVADVAAVQHVLGERQLSHVEDAGEEERASGHAEHDPDAGHAGRRAQPLARLVQQRGRASASRSRATSRRTQARQHERGDREGHAVAIVRLSGLLTRSSRRRDRRAGGEAEVGYRAVERTWLPATARARRGRAATRARQA